jgi:predicted transcriptional regulator
MARVGRPSKLHPEITAAIIQSLKIGATYRDAAEAAGIAYQTFLNWMAKGESAKSGNFKEFFDQVRRAESRARLNFTAVIAKSANDGDWRAALEFLKRRDRANWGDYSRQDIANIDVTKLTDEQLARIADGEDILYVIANPDTSAS